MVPFKNKKTYQKFCKIKQFKGLMLGSFEFKRMLKLLKKIKYIVIHIMKLNEIKKLEQKTSRINDEINKRYNLIICKFHSNSPATHRLITGEYPNYTETMICNKCSDHMNNLTCYELDIRKIVDLFKL